MERLADIVFFILVFGAVGGAFCGAVALIGVVSSILPF